MPVSKSSPSDQSRQPASPQETSTVQWVVSFLFWGQLLLAGALYGAVALAPKIARHVELQREFDTNQVQLVQLEQKVEELKKVTESLQRDPWLLEEIARIDLDAIRPGEERILLQEELTLQSRIGSRAESLPVDSVAWYSPALSAFAANHRLRRVSLLVAGALVIAAFTFFQPSQVERFQTGWTSTCETGLALLARYRSG